MATAVSQGQSPWTMLKKAIGLDRKPAPPAKPQRLAAYDDYWALHQRKDPRPLPKK